MCIGKNTQYAPIKVNQKWILPSVSFIIRPNIFGNQKYNPPKAANSGAIAITGWKGGTTKYVSCNEMPAADVPRKSPLNPPLTNIDTNPMANKPAAVNLIRAPHTVPSQLNVFTADGTAMRSVVSVKTE